MDSRTRQAVRAELASQGYAWDYVDSWPPKTTLYVHKPLLNVEGKVVADRGVAMENQPGNPDHAARKSRIGLLPWPPSKACKCKACREFSASTNGVVQVDSPPIPQVDSPQIPQVAVTVVRGRPKGKNIGLPRGKRTR